MRARHVWITVCHNCYDFYFYISANLSLHCKNVHVGIFYYCFIALLCQLFVGILSSFANSWGGNARLFIKLFKETVFGILSDPPFLFTIVPFKTL